MGTDDALVFTAGYLANVGCIATLLDPGDTVICDSGDHASILDAVMMSRARIRPFRHNRMDKLETMLERAAGDGGGVLVVVDGVFSMEGDVAPLGEIVDLCSKHGARLMVDEAHGVGVLGARGAGACEALGVEDRVDLRMGTFSKSLASCGGFIAGPGRRDRLPADPVARVHVHRLRRAGGRGRGARSAADPPLRGGPAALCERDARERRATSATGFKRLGYETIDSDPVTPDHPGPDRRRLAGRPALARALRRRRVRERRASTRPSRRAARCCARA